MKQTETYAIKVSPSCVKRVRDTLVSKGYKLVSESWHESIKRSADCVYTYPDGSFEFYSHGGRFLGARNLVELHNLPNFEA